MKPAGNVPSFMLEKKSKKWYESKTVWLNTLTIAIGILLLAADTFPEASKILLFLSSALNIILRVIFTKTEIQK